MKGSKLTLLLLTFEAQLTERIRLVIFIDPKKMDIFLVELQHSASYFTNISNGRRYAIIMCSFQENSVNDTRENITHDNKNWTP